MTHTLQNISRSLINTKFRRPWLFISRPFIRHLFPRLTDKAITTYDNDVRININSDDQIQSQIYWYGFHQGDALSFKTFIELIDEHATVFDIGANVGAFSLPLAKKAARGHIYSFEPMKEAFGLLTDNISLNGFKNITASKVAVSDAAGETSIHTPSAAWKGLVKNKGMTTVYPSTALLERTDAYVKEDVGTIGLDQFISSHNIQKVDFVKIDVEGSEMKVLQGMRQCLDSQHPTILLEINLELLARANVTPDDILALLRGYNYTVQVITGSSIKALASDASIARNCNILCTYSS